MVDSVGSTSGTTSSGMGINDRNEPIGNAAYESGKATNGDVSTDNVDIGIADQTITTADRLLSSPTTREQLGGSLTTADVLSAMQSVTERLADLECLPDGIDLSKKIQCDGSLYANQDKSIQIGHGRFEYTPPNAAVDPKTLKASATVGLDAELTAFDGKLSVPVGEIGSIDARYRIGTVNGHAKAEANAEFSGFDFKKSGASLNASVGGEAMKWDVRYSADARITPKSVGDTLSGIYNEYMDPVVDYVAERDIPEIPPIPDYLDHGIVLDGHITIGEGISGKIGGNVEIGKGQIFKMSGRIKGGIGSVFGAGASIGVK